MKLSYLLFATTLVAAPASFAQIDINVPGLVKPAAGDVTIDGNHVTKSIVCKNNSVFVRGNMNSAQIGGTCKAVHVMGNKNNVTVDHATTLVTEGNDNTVNYLDAETKVNTLGNGNRISLSK